MTRFTMKETRRNRRVEVNPHPARVTTEQVLKTLRREPTLVFPIPDRKSITSGNLPVEELIKKAEMKYAERVWETRNKE